MESVLGYLPYIIQGFGVTVFLALVAIAGEMVVGFLFVLMRRSRLRPVRGLAITVVEVFRGTSEVVQMFWVFFSLPILTSLQFPPVVAAILVLSVNGGSYASEVMRGALDAVPRVQKEACVALGFSSRTSMRRVLLPQAFAIMLPSLANVAINTAKATSVVSLITVADLAFRVQNVRMYTGESIAAYLIALGLYLLLTTTLALVFEGVEHQLPVNKAARSSKRKVVVG